MRYDLKAGFEQFVGAGAVGGTMNALTSHPANPVTPMQWYVSGGATLLGLAAQFAGNKTGSRMLENLGDGAFGAGSGYLVGNLVQIARNKFVANAAATTTTTTTPAAYVGVRGGGAATADWGY